AWKASGLIRQRRCVCFFLLNISSLRLLRCRHVEMLYVQVTIVDEPSPHRCLDFDPAYIGTWLSDAISSTTMLIRQDAEFIYVPVNSPSKQSAGFAI
ncbi:hypothetical protein EDB19DRAFT_1737244, partial [Suillus lakei]